MNSKWYIGTLILVFCVLGISRQQLKATPNQEIVLQFSSEAIDDSVAHSAIANVKKQLEAIGVTEVNILDAEKGILKITYYSNLEVSAIKHLLSAKKQATLGYVFPSETSANGTGFPSEEKNTAYELQVFELQQGNDLDAGLSGKFALESRSDKDRFSNPNYAVGLSETTKKLHASLNVRMLPSSYSNTIAFTDLFLRIPEVRAGPFA